MITSKFNGFKADRGINRKRQENIATMRIGVVFCPFSVDTSVNRKILDSSLKSYSNYYVVWVYREFFTRIETSPLLVKD